MPRRRSFYSVPISKQAVYRGALWASVLVFGLSAASMCLLRLFPGPTLSGASDVAFKAMIIPLLPGLIAGQIVFMNVQESHAGYAAAIWSEISVMIVLNWTLYFLLFTYFIHSRIQKKRRTPMERISF